MKNIFFTDESVKINGFKSEKYFFNDESVKRQLTDSISENLTDSDLESIYVIFFNLKKKLSSFKVIKLNNLFLIFLPVLYLNQKNIFLN